MKHLWTTAAAAALLVLTATGAEAAPEKKSQAEVAKTLRPGAEKKKTARPEPAGATEAARTSRTRGKKTEADPAPAKGPVAKGPLKTEASAPITVGRGDTLGEVAKKAGIDRQTLIELNGLKPPYALKAGQKLRGPERRYYAVQSGDTLYAVSRRFKVPVDELAAFNDTDLNRRIQIGEKIYIPDDAAGAPRPTKLAAAEKPSNAKPKAAKPAAAEAAAASRSSTRTAAATPKATSPANPKTSEARLAMAAPPARPAMTAPAAAAAPPPAAAPRATPPAATAALDPAVGIETRELPAAASAVSTPTARPQPSVAPQAPSPVVEARAEAPVTTPAASAGASGADAVRSADRAAPRPQPTAPAAQPLEPAPTRMAAASRQSPSTLQPARAAAVSRPAADARPDPSRRQAFETPPARPAAGQLPPPGGVPYASLNQPSPRTSGRRGRPEALPPSIAREAPSSQPPMIVASAPITTSDIVAAGRGRFIWPVRGEVLSRFGPKGPGQRNDGVNISARSGEQVRAAADGKVVYAGDQVPTFGNLVLLQHPNGWVTAYAHLQGISVKNNDVVSQGQPIGIAGASGAVGQPQLHFEMRYAASPREKAAPVDPMLILPAG